MIQCEVKEVRCDTLEQRFPTFYVCDPKGANDTWPTTLPWKQQYYGYKYNYTIL
jgi:hypothetical protein